MKKTLNDYKLKPTHPPIKKDIPYHPQFKKIGDVAESVEGSTLRDEFALAAIPSLITIAFHLPKTDIFAHGCVNVAEFIAKEAYVVADALLRERE